MTKGNYVDGFVIPIPKKNKAKYLKMAREGCLAWKKFGALDYKECVLEDGAPPFVTVTFPKMAKAKTGRNRLVLLYCFQIKGASQCREQKGDGVFFQKVWQRYG